MRVPRRAIWVCEPRELRWGHDKKDMTSKTWHDMIIQDRETIQDKPIGGQGRHEGLEVGMRIETFELDCLKAPGQVGMEPVEHGENKTEQRL